MPPTVRAIARHTPQTPVFRPAPTCRARAGGERRRRFAFLFDFGSPHAYFCRKVIPAIEARTGAHLTDLPVLLGGLFSLADTQPAEERGAFGSPTFFVDGDVDFGKDRLRDVQAQIVHRQTT